jgi:hypothetical protein
LALVPTALPPVVPHVHEATTSLFLHSLQLGLRKQEALMRLHMVYCRHAGFFGHLLRPFGQMLKAAQLCLQNNI